MAADATQWIDEIAHYWRREFPERDFARNRVLLLLSRLAFALPAFQKKALLAFGLTPSDYSILGALRRAGQPRQLNPGDLYTALGCTPGGLTKMVERLEKQGLVQRSSDPEDRRRAHIRLTARGAAVERKAFAEYNESADRLLGRLSPDELAQVDEALALLVRCFEEDAA